MDPANNQLCKHHYLTPEQIQNPLPIIEEFFHNYDLQECRSLLREILHQALSGYSNRDGIHPADLLRFLEELEKATDAMYLITQKNSARTIKRNKSQL